MHENETGTWPAPAGGDGRPGAEATEVTASRTGELANPRVSYAIQHENDGPPKRRQELVTSRAARAMRDGNRHMDGSPRPGRARFPRSPRPSQPSRDSAGITRQPRRQASPYERGRVLARAATTHEAEAGA